MEDEYEQIIQKVMAIMLSVAIASQTFDLNVFAQNVQTEQSVSGGDAEESNEANGWDGVTTQDVFEGNGYRVTFTLTGHWEGGYNANIRIENTGTEDIYYYLLDFYDYSNYDLLQDQDALGYFRSFELFGKEHHKVIWTKGYDIL